MYSLTQLLFSYPPFADMPPLQSWNTVISIEKYSSGRVEKKRERKGAEIPRTPLLKFMT